MSQIEQRDPEPQGQWITETSNTPQPQPTTQAQWTTPVVPVTTTPYGWTTSYTVTTDCNCDYEPPTTSSTYCLTPIIVTPTTPNVIPIVTTPANVVVVNHGSGGGLSPGAVGGIVVGVFFGVLLLFLLCICLFSAFFRPRYYGSDSSSTSSRDRRPRPKHPIVIVDPYPRRPTANLTFVGGGNYPGTRVMITKTQKTFVRPPSVKQVRTFRETRRTEKIRIIDDDE